MELMSKQSSAIYSPLKLQMQMAFSWPRITAKQAQVTIFENWLPLDDSIRGFERNSEIVHCLQRVGEKNL